MPHAVDRAPSRNPPKKTRLALAAAALLGAALAVQAQQPPPAGQIFTCDDGHGHKLTSDRPIPECVAREQRVLNSDGSVRRVLPPTMTADERAEAEAKEQQLNAQRMAQQDDVRRDRNLMKRYRDETAHNKARELALDDVRLATKASETRLKALASERKPLLEEAEFYKKDKRLPPKLKQQLEANEVAAEAQRQLLANQQAEFARINTIYDAELDRLRKLWAGKPPGSLGPILVSTAASASAPAAAASPASSAGRPRPPSPPASGN